MTPTVNVSMSEYLPPSPQGDWPEPTKFDKLRIKTEMQLVQLINAELDLGIRDARQGLKSIDTRAIVEGCHRRAKRASVRVARLIPLVAEITEDERNRVESKLNRLQRMLEALTTIGSTPTPAEDEIAALARAVWEARGCPEGLPEEDWFRAERALKAQRQSVVACSNR
jgi:HAMP domain-containing protein